MTQQGEEMFSLVVYAREHELKRESIATLLLVLDNCCTSDARGWSVTPNGPPGYGASTALEGLVAVLDGTITSCLVERSGVARANLVHYKDTAECWLQLEMNLHRERQETAFLKLAESLGVGSVHYVPQASRSGGWTREVIEIALQRQYAMHGAESSSVEIARGLAALLPRLRFQTVDDIGGAPARLGWLNYWSARAAGAIGFPDDSKDQRLMPLARRLDDGAWFVKLTAEPLDVMRPDHVEALAWAYWRFDKVGKRMTQTTIANKVRKGGHDKKATGDRTKRFALRERDVNGQWWDSAAEPITADSAANALKIYFARNAYGRKPKANESLRKLADAYDEVAAEVGLTRAADIEAVEFHV